MALIIYGVSIFVVFILTLVVWSIIYNDDGMLLRKEIALGILAIAVSFAPIIGTVIAIMGVVMFVTYAVENNVLSISTWFNQPAIVSRKNKDDGA